MRLLSLIATLMVGNFAEANMAPTQPALEQETPVIGQVFTEVTETEEPKEDANDLGTARKSRYSDN